MLKPDVKPNDGGSIIKVQADGTIRETFDKVGPREAGGTIINARILPSAQFPDPMDYCAPGYKHSANVIVPDDLKWGQLFRRCFELGDMCQTDLFPVGAAPRNEIETFIEKMLEERQRRQRQRS